jgi:hypothetical protein
MAEIQRLFQPDPAFDPETIEVLAAALDNAWETIENLAVGSPGPPIHGLCGK